MTSPQQCVVGKKNHLLLYKTIHNMMIVLDIFSLWMDVLI